MNRFENQQKRKQAKRLYLFDGLLQKEIAEKLEVSRKTVCQWANDDQWNDKEKWRNRNKGGLLAMMKRFFDFADKKQPGIAESIKKLWTDFLQFDEKRK